MNNLTLSVKLKYNPSTIGRIGGYTDIKSIFFLSLFEIIIMSFWQSQLIAKPVRQKKHEDDISLKLLTWKKKQKKKHEKGN